MAVIELTLNIFTYFLLFTVKSSLQILLAPVWLCLLFLYGCQSNNKPASSIERDGEPTIYMASVDDAEMVVAAKKARATLPLFLAALQQHDSTAYNFAVKLPFNAGDGKEYIWLGNPVFEQGKWYGTVNNEPEYTRQVKLGEKVQWDTSRVADWNYTLNGKLVGGYSIRLLRSRMTPEERAEFDKSTDWVIQ